MAGTGDPFLTAIAIPVALFFGGLVGISVMQISDAWRNIIFGLIILAMLLLQTLRKKGG